MFKYTFVFVYRYLKSLYTLEIAANSPLEAMDMFAKHYGDEKDGYNVIAVLTQVN